MTTVKFAVPCVEKSLESQVSPHFGHCALFAVLTGDKKEKKIVKAEFVENVAHEHGGCDAPVSLLAAKQISAVLAAGIGMRPLSGFTERGIKVYYAGPTTVESAANAFLEGKLELLGDQNVCSHSKW